MKKNNFYKKSAFLLILSMAMFSCDLLNLNWGGNKYKIGHFPTLPVNLEEFNTEFDDYNSDIPVFLDVFPFCFSSNRNSNGENYDIVYKLMAVEFSKIKFNYFIKLLTILIITINNFSCQEDNLEGEIISDPALIEKLYAHSSDTVIIENQKLILETEIYRNLTPGGGPFIEKDRKLIAPVWIVNTI